MSNKLNLRIGGQRSQYRWTPYHLTTMNVGKPQCQFKRMLYPGDKISVDMSSFVRLQPLAVPSYVRGKEKFISTFVPLYQVDDFADDYLS